MKSEQESQSDQWLTELPSRQCSFSYRHLLQGKQIDPLPNYGQRWRNGQRISSAFVESAVNQIIDKRMSKSQQMRWDPKSAHQLLQVRVRVIDGLLREDFSRWHPDFPANASSLAVAA